MKTEISIPYANCTEPDSTFSSNVDGSYMNSLWWPPSSKTLLNNLGYFAAAYFRQPRHYLYFASIFGFHERSDFTTGLKLCLKSNV